MGVEPDQSPRLGLPQWRHGLLAAGGLILVLALVLMLLFPWGISAYYLEMAGQRLEAKGSPGIDYIAAERGLRQALAWVPDNAQAYRLLAKIYGLQGDRTAAVEALAGYVALRPKDPLAYWELAIACEQLAAPELSTIFGQPCGVDEESRQAALVRLWQAASLSAADFVQAGDELLQISDGSKAEAFYRRALLLEPETAAAWCGLGQVYQARNEPSAALEAYTRAIVLNSDLHVTAKAYDGRGRILADAQRWSEASTELAHAVALAPDEGQYHLNYGWYLYKAGGDRQEARTALSEAANALPKDPLPHLHLAELDFAEGDYAGMLAHAQQAVEIQPKLFWGWVSLGRALRFLDRLVEAQEALSRAIELVPDEATPHAELGHVLTAQNRLEEASAEYEQAVALAPDNAQYHHSIAWSLHKLKRYEDAASAFERALELEETASSYRGLGDSYYRLGEYDQALTAFQRWAELEPNNAAAWSAAAWAFNKLERYEEAVKAFSHGLELAETASLYQGLGDSHFRLKDYEQALAAFTKWTALEPDNAAAHNSAGWMYLLLKDCPNAIGYFEKALEIDPELRQAQDGLARCRGS